ncbi:hypothetical protein THERMOT_2230 [Bathymodiolus thermophilus thioautotrophic gill symbiont]|uniref:FG-GAP-like repeat-containing protein n=1 Tax=Bathymodiolus thermophilus thioautotrophic gill symbiont TaxID=2360 RepID=UPI00192BB2CB|nr:FG-GAP-like repeat-containing protein [Bathymodiolus thermophilus thioautotrophic gill symbiont]CAB5505847.1 hypothetical protein THERMOT_2230 [Bathymodiolus thermophilus thioautotrophic gill symbiont]
MQVKTQKQVIALQNKVQKVADQLNEEVIAITKDIQHIQTQIGVAYQLNTKDFDTKKLNLIAKKVGDDLEVALEESVVIFDNYFTICTTDLSCLVSLPTKDGGLYHIVADAFFTLEDGTQVVYFYGEQSIVSTESRGVSTDDKQSFFDVITSNIGIAVAVAAIVVIASIGSDNDEESLTFTFADAGGTTNNTTITVSGLKEGETWQYSVDGGASFTDGTNSSFVLREGTYAKNAIQVKQIDAAGNILIVVKNASPIVVDTTNPLFTSEAVVDIEINAEASETVYIATTTDNNTIAYTLENGNQKEKFTINRDTGELKYKHKQTTAHDNDKVTIIATDAAGNETKQLVTVSVKDSVLSTSVIWNNIDNNINIAELAVVTLSGSVAPTNTTFTDLSITSIVFKQNNTIVYVVNIALPVINNNIWALGHDDAWASKLVDGNCTVVVNLSANSGSVTGQGETVVVIDITAPVTPGLNFIDTGLSDDGITKNNTITVGDLEAGVTWQYSVNSGANFIEGEGNSFTLDEGAHAQNTIQIKQTDAAGNVSSVTVNASTIIVDTTDPLFFSTGNVVNVRTNSAVTTTIYDARVVNHTGGNVDEGITYSIKGANASKFSITTDTGIVTYKTMQTVAHNDAITIVATDVAGNESEQSIVVSVKTLLQGFTINGKSAGDESGYSVSSAGDVNGDGLDDLIIGAYKAGSENQAGQSFVVFGKVDGVAVNLSTIVSGTGGFVINGESAGDYSGFSVSSAGDVNGDGLDDLIIGAYKAKNKAGQSFVVFGKADGAAVNLSTITPGTGTGGFVINGDKDETADRIGDYSGFSVSSAGDVNGDGLDDLIVGAYGVDLVDKPQAGQSFVVFGKANGAVVNLSTLNTGGFVINGEKDYDWSGYSVSSAGDVNGDGLDDLIIGAYKAGSDSKNKAGKSFVVFSKIDGAIIDLSTVASDTGTAGFVINGEKSYDGSGFSVSSAGDVNGDGLDDLIVGAYKAENQAGKSYVVFGKVDGVAVDLSAIASGTGGFVIHGESAWDKSGFSASSAGDVNGDGLDDLIVGASQANSDGKSNTGKSYVVFGKDDGFAVNLSAIASGTGGFVINGENAGDYSGFSVSSAGDVNGDGLDDLIVGAFGADLDGIGIGIGKSFVIFGKTDTKAVDLADISAAGGDIAHAIDFQGDTNADKNDTLTGTSVDELFVAGLGNDVLTGNGGTDVFNAGKGDDTIIINADNLAKLSSKVLSNHLLARVDGGGNTDTLKLAGTDLTLDLTQIDNGRIQDIEIIDLTGSGDNILKLNLNDLLDISSSTNVLKVMGDAGDKVDIELSGNAFIQGSAETKDGVTYDIYSNANASTAKLWIDQDLAVV